MLGMQYTQAMMLFRPLDWADPRVKVLLDMTNWRAIKDEFVMMALPTLENYYDLIWSGLSFIPTRKIGDWLARERPIRLESWERDDDSPLFEYQQDASAFLQRHDRAMLSLSPGLGKTLTAADAAGRKNFKNILVVCPASLLYYWDGELRKWADKLPMKPFPAVMHREVTSGLGGGTLLEDRQAWWGITNPETVVKHLEEFVVYDPPYDCLILDESIMYKNRESQRSKAIKELASVIDTVWLLTGAPATKLLDDMWHQFHILKPKGYPSYWRFVEKYVIVNKDEWGSKLVANKPNAEKEIKKNFADIYFSRTQDDVADIPDWIMEDINIPMLPKQDAAYEELRKKLRVELATVDPGEYVTVNNHLSLMVRSVQVASNPLLVGGVDSAGKWDALPELMSFYPGPYLVWVNFIKTGELLRDHFSKIKKRVALANGATKMEDRNKMVDAFQNGELDVLVLNNQVGKFGFTLTKARTAFFVERMYDDSYFQCLHRNRRIGTTESPVIVNMRSVTADGYQTIDHLIHSTLDYRVGMIKKVTASDLLAVFDKKKI